MVPRDAVVCLAALAAAVAACAPEPVGIAAGACGAFRGRSRMAVALNAYYLQEEATRALRSGASLAPHVEEVLVKARQLGVTILRTNGFNDGREQVGDSAMQVAPLTYDETAMRGLDLVLVRAETYGVRLVLPLGNYWDDYGGARRYVEWAGLPDPREGDPRFFTDRAVVDHYREHVRWLLSRVNTFDGVPYREHPAVLAFELLNEPRGAGLDAAGAEMRAWVDEIAHEVKALAPDKLVGTGEEGFDVPGSPYDAAFWRDAAPRALFAAGSSYVLNTASPWVDYGSVQLYPDAWGIRSDLTVSAGLRWIMAHVRAAGELGKPVLVSEFGLRADGPLDLDERRAAYEAWLASAAAAGAVAAAPWGFAYDDRPAAWDPHTFYLRDGTAPDDPVNSYADLILSASCE